MSSFNYCPHIWMLCGKTSNKEIDMVRASRILLNDYNASFEELLERSKETPIQVKKFPVPFDRSLQVSQLPKSYVYVGYVQKEKNDV